MRTNERIEELKAFFHNPYEQRTLLSIEDFAKRVARELRIPTQNLHVNGTGAATQEHGIKRIEDHLYFRPTPYGSEFRRTSEARKTKLPNVLALKGAYNVSTGSDHVTTHIEVHVPVSYDKHGGSGFHFTTLESTDRTPLLTIARTANAREPAKVIVTSHSSVGHKLAQVLTARLHGIASQFRGEDGAKLPTPEIELVKGENVKLPTPAKRQTRREQKMQGLAAIEASATLKARLAEAERALATAREQREDASEKLIGESQAHARTRGILEELTTRHDAATDRLRQIREEARAGFGKRGTALKRIRRINH
ncbi:MAG: hypothetical protein V1644_00780 [Candidatus Micrarchaeota archaeon]